MKKNIEICLKNLQLQKIKKKENIKMEDLEFKNKSRGFTFFHMK